MPMPAPGEVWLHRYAPCSAPTRGATRRRPPPSLPNPACAGCVPRVCVPLGAAEEGAGGGAGEPRSPFPPRSESVRRSLTPLVPGQLFSEEVLRSLIRHGSAASMASAVGRESPSATAGSPPLGTPAALQAAADRASGSGSAVALASPRGPGGMARADAQAAGGEAAQFKTRRVPGGLKLVRTTAP